MKFKTITLFYGILAATLMMPQGAWALSDLIGDAPVFSLATTGTSFGTNGGSSAVETKYTKDGTDYWMMDLEPAVIAVGASDGAAWEFSNNTQYIKVVLSNAIKVGDFIVINGYNNTNSSGYYFRIFDNSTSSTSAGPGKAFDDQATPKTTAKDLTYVVTDGNCLVGQTTFYLRWSTKNAKGYLNSIKVYSGPTTLPTDKTWDFTGFNTLDATSTAMIADDLLYGKGISIATIEGTQVLNLPKNGSTFNVNNSLAMFKVNGKGKVTFTYYANTTGTKPFAHKIGTAAGESELLGEKKFKSSYFTFDVNEDTPIYLYTADNSSGTFYLKDITVTFAPTIPINTIDYATFSSSEALDFTGLSQKAYIVTAQSDGTLTYAQVNKVPAATGLLIVGTAGETVKPAFLAKDEAADVISTNLLKPTLTATTVGTTEGADYGKVWVLGNQGGTPGFYKSNDGRSLAVGKAYLYLDSGISSAPEFFAFDFGGETTDINDVKRETITNNGFYNLNGQRVSQPKKGLYIVNGKKVIIK